MTPQQEALLAEIRESERRLRAQLGPRYDECMRKITKPLRDRLEADVLESMLAEARKP